MTPEVQEAVREIREAFSEHEIQVEPDSQGGAHITIQGVDVGDHYQPTTTWIGFLIPFQYPMTDVYPHFIDSNVRRANGEGHGSGFQSQQWQSKPAWQVSRRSNRWNPAVDTALVKLTKVIDWIRKE